ncbi:MAG: MipA/OmpV family protein [Gammaproteobacteria bacterium]|nr:MipA/OmpV family protein [Gammaproteobacteria bacterium]
MTSGRRQPWWLVALMGALPLAVMANDDAAVVATEASVDTHGWFPDSPFWWDVALGANATLQHSLLYTDHSTYYPGLELTLFLSGEYGPFFLETQDRRVTSFADSGRIGVYLYRHEQLEFSLTYGNYMEEISEEGYDSTWGDKVDELIGIDTREADGNLGLRLLHENRRNIYSLEFGRDVTGSHNSYIGELSYTHIEQVRNADLRFNAVLTYFHQDVVDYYFGVRGSEVTANRPAYAPGASYRVHTSLSALQPISESWLFESGLGVSYYGQEIADSPLVASPFEGMLMLGVHYVF